MSPSGSGVSVLCVDDDRSFVAQFISKASLIDSQLAFTTAYDFEQAKKLIKSKKSDVVLIDLDLQDSKGDGFDLVKLCAQTDDLLSAVVLSNIDDVQTIKKVLSLGAADFISKSATAAEIVMRIHLAREKNIERALQNQSKHTDIIANSASMKKALKVAKVISQNPHMSVLILGETGVGKDVVARYINEQSQNSRNFVDINCAAIPETMAEATLFGYEQGAFTGASKSAPGKFEIAHGGDLFLDELGTLSLAIQAKLLRVIETKTVQRLGSHRSHMADARIIAATNEGVSDMMEKGQFRRDLYERIASYEIVIPPLRDRKEDILPLTEFFIQKLGRTDLKLSKECQKIFLNYEWPGNIRELKQVISVMVAFAQGTILTPSLLPPKILKQMQNEPSADAQSFGEQKKGGTQKWSKVEAEMLDRYLRQCIATLGQKSSIRSLAALTGIPRTSLTGKLKKMGLNLD